MKNIMTIAAPLVLGITSLLSHNASAIPIVGEVSFAGSYVVDNSNLLTATKFTSFSGVTVSALPTGDYAGLAASSVTMTPFSFDPFPVGGVVPLWTIPSVPGTSFDLLAISVTRLNASTLVLSGSGIAHKAGKDNTPGTWVMTANTFGQTFSFSSTNASVPDGGTTVALLGIGLVGVEGLRRKLGATKL